MKTLSLFILIAMFTSCSSTQYFSRTWTDEETGQQMMSDTIVFIRPFGVINALWEKEPTVRYKLKWGNLFCGAIFLPTIIIPVTMWRFFLFEADKIEGDVDVYVKVDPDRL